MITTKNIKQPYKVILYGTEGVGKTTLALQAKGYLLLDIENGSKHMANVRRVDNKKNDLSSTTLIEDALRFAYQDDETKTVIIDSLTAINKIFEREILDELGVESMSFDYNKGNSMMSPKWDKLLNMINALVTKASKNVILIGHSEATSSHDALLGVDTKKEQPHIHLKSLKNILADVDGVYYYAYDKNVDSTKGKGLKVVRGNGNRMLITSGFDDRYVAKNRLTDVDNIYIFKPNDLKAMIEFWEVLSTDKKAKITMSKKKEVKEVKEVKEIKEKEIKDV